MKITIFLLLISFSAYAASDLVKTYTDRRKTVETRKRRETYKLLRDHSFRPDDLLKLEILDQSGKAVLQFRNNDVCYGDTSLNSLECFNFAGTQTFLNVGNNGYSSFVGNALVDLFIQRKNLTQDSLTVSIFDFLGQQSFDTRDLIEFEKLNDRGKFAARFKNDDVCFGDIETNSLSCYNAIGFRTFFEKGDLD